MKPASQMMDRLPSLEIPAGALSQLVNPSMPIPPPKLVNGMAGLVQQPQRKIDPALICSKHNHIYQNYCESDHEPLCNNCIAEHHELHNKVIIVTPAIFVTMDEALEKMRNKMAKLRVEVEGQLEIVSTEDILSHLEDMVQRVIIAKKEMITEINKIAESRLKDIEIIETNYRKIQLKKPFIEAAEVINKHIVNLQGMKKVEEVQYCYLFDEANFKSQFNATVKHNQAELEKSKCEINYDKVQFRKMVNECFRLNIPSYGHIAEDDDVPNDKKVTKTLGGKMFESFVNNLNKAVEEENNYKLARINELFLKDTNKNISLKPEQERKIEENNLMKKAHQEKKLIIQEDPLAPDAPTFNPNQPKDRLPINPNKELKYVHYYEIGSYNLHLYNLAEGVFETRKLKMPEPVPFYHKSVQVSDGTIFLSGGRNSMGKTARRNTFLYSYSIVKDVFKIAQKGLKPRSSHSLVEHKGLLYIVGGFSEHNYERQVECFDLPDTSKGIRYLRPSQFAGECIATSVNDFIWKISVDGLELYSSKDDEWRHVVINNFIYYESCLCATVNYDQVFIFGGYDQSERGIRNTHIIRQTKIIEKLKQIDNQTFVIEKRDWYKMLDGEGFSDNNVAMNKDNLYVFCNTSNEFNEIITDTKNLITFDGQRWKYVPRQKDDLAILQR